MLLRLFRAPGHRLKRVDLVEQVLLTPSGITRLLGRLEQAGLVEKANCETDARVTYAVLTRDGLRKLRAATRSHTAEIESVLGGEYSQTGAARAGAICWPGCRRRWKMPDPAARPPFDLHGRVALVSGAGSPDRDRIRLRRLSASDGGERCDHLDQRPHPRPRARARAPA